MTSHLIAFSFPITLNFSVVAIRGINDKNFRNILKCGANYVAISSYIWKNKRLNPKDALKKLIL